MGSYYLDGREIKVSIQDGATINAFVTAVGAKGDTGATGETGATGATGTSLRNLGTWSSATAYVNNASYTDLVYYNGSYYACKVSNTNQVPTNTTYWDLIVSKGDTGATGPSGVGFTETGYYPVDYNLFKCTTTTDGGTNVTIPLTRQKGNLTVASNIITLTKGYFYEFEVSFSLASSGAAQITIANTSNVNQMDRIQHAWTSNYYSAPGFSNQPGYGLIDLTSAGSDMQVKAIVVTATSPAPRVDTNFGYLAIRKMKKVTI